VDQLVAVDVQLDQHDDEVGDGYLEISYGDGEQARESAVEHGKGKLRDGVRCGRRCECNAFNFNLSAWRGGGREAVTAERRL
jgi:hypothetical protein